MCHLGLNFMLKIPKTGVLSRIQVFHRENEVVENRVSILATEFEVRCSVNLAYCQFKTLKNERINPKPII